LGTFGRARDAQWISCSLVTGELKKRCELTEGLFSCADAPSTFGRQQMAPDPHVSAARSQVPARAINHGFVCDVAGCHARPFRHRGDLTRHKLSHNPRRLHDCPVSGCNRKGSRGFPRKDKLLDHMLAGHDEDTPFTCPHCGDEVARDVIALHLGDRPARHTPLKNLYFYTTCPLPRCSFKVHICSLDWSQKLQNHLREKHDTMERGHYTNLLHGRGYDAQSGECLCPICPSGLHFSNINDFIEHFMHVHFEGPLCYNHTDGSCVKNCYGRKASYRLRRCTSVPEEVRKHRRTILRIWPEFTCYPVWSDIKCRTTTG
jgi:hypothetical protein